LSVGFLVAAEVYLEHTLFSGRDFDSVEWHAWGGQRWCDGDSPRLAMVDDLRTNHLRIGMRRAAVIQLLGPPDYKWAPRDLEWGLGGLIDCEFLDLTFDKSRRLKLVERTQG
jgi:hypothetical protein